MARLQDLLKVNFPATNIHAASRLHEFLQRHARAHDWAQTLELAWPALEPIFSATPYLASLAKAIPSRLKQILQSNPDDHLALIIQKTTQINDLNVNLGRAELRQLKSELHLLTALADIGGVWTLSQVTHALSLFADAVIDVAIRLAIVHHNASFNLPVGLGGSQGPLPGYFCVGMGKLGAFELNYSSDIDICFFYDFDRNSTINKESAHLIARQITEYTTDALQARELDGYVFRVDLRLRPDPFSTSIAVSVASAQIYYESVGQNWERAALIKARIVAGDRELGNYFLKSLEPFIWRKNLDYAAIVDIQLILTQIHSRSFNHDDSVGGANVKLGRGGIREIELFVQTQQLILGGRHLHLRSPQTLEALKYLLASGHVNSCCHDDLSAAYNALRKVEHCIQMLNDEQSHQIPLDIKDRTTLAQLSGHGTLRRFDKSVSRHFHKVHQHTITLFSFGSIIASKHGPLIFTGVGDDSETMDTLKRMGFLRPDVVSATIRSWTHGQIAATKTERGRELLTRLAPRLLDSMCLTGAPDVAFIRFCRFFSQINAGVQFQSLLLNQQELLVLLIRLMAFGPRLAQILARHPATLDSLLDPNFFRPIIPAEDPTLEIDPNQDFEFVINAARRTHREQAFRIGVHVLAGIASAAEAGMAFAALADAMIKLCSRAAAAELVRKAGHFEGDFTVIALGKCGSREMNAVSDLDIMTVYCDRGVNSRSTVSNLAAETYFGRLTQRLITALSTRTAEGEMYEVDVQLRPSGTKGPVSVSFAAFEYYYELEAETWEFLALTKARVVWSTSHDFGDRVTFAIDRALRRPRNREAIAVDVREMRSLINAERATGDFWDLKFSEGGMVDIEFSAQFLQLVNAQQGGPLRQNTEEALTALLERQFIPVKSARQLIAAWRLQQSIFQLLKVALENGADPDQEPKALQLLLAQAGRCKDYSRLRTKLTKARESAHRSFLHLV